MAIKFDQTSDGQYLLDVRGYSCPHPQMYTKKALQKMCSGDELTLIFDNPSSGESIEVMLANEGNDLLERDNADGNYTWKIRKA